MQDSVKAVVDVELSMGQMIDDVKIALDGLPSRVLLWARPAAWFPRPADVAAVAKHGNWEVRKMAIVYQKSKGLTDAELHYCPGCTHGIIHKLVAEALEEMGVVGNTIGVAPVGCSVFAYNYFNCDMHGGRSRSGSRRGHRHQAGLRTGAPSSSPTRATATWPPSARRRSSTPPRAGEKITTIFINNAIYGMTGGQMAPTTLVGQKATTAPYGPPEGSLRLPHPHVPRCISTLEGCAYAARVLRYGYPQS